MEFQGKHVVVTGGSGALGSAVVAALVEREAHVHVPVFAPKELDRFALRTHERVSVRAGLDMTVERTVEHYYAELHSLYASIHVAGGFAMAKLADTSLQDLLHLMNMNAVTCFLATREAVKAIRKSGGGGRVVNVAAKPGMMPSLGAGLAAYTASKAAVVALTQALAEELAPEGIWVNAVAPSTMDTPANRASMPDADHASWPKPSEVAEAIVQLASPKNAVVRGAIVPVFGRA
ncbi:MAG: SDR family NAD(P)-dependent oxidoreductase [Sandaracinaceae bacterium]|nr:SDR family NAD(P)-dependent oxidoreductase [Sandaracinaceae bacterium]